MTHIRCPKCKRTSVDVEGAELDEDGALPHESGDMVEFLLGGRGVPALLLELRRR